MVRIHKWITALLIALTIVAAGCGAGAPEATATESKAAAGQVVVKVLDIGQGDAVLLKTAEQTVLIDTGDVGKRDEIVKLLKRERVTVIDKLIITHPHADHMGGAYAVFNNFTVKAVFDPGRVATSNTYKTYLKTIEKQKISYEQLLAGTILDLGGGAAFEVFSPTDDLVKHEDNINNTSIVGKLEYGNFSMMFTGDCEAEVEKVLVKQYGSKLRSKVLKSPHHGSKTSSNRNYLKAVAPEAVVISLGAANDYGHPHQQTLNKYADLQIKVYRTDRDGTVTITTDGDSYAVGKEK